MSRFHTPACLRPWAFAAWLPAVPLTAGAQTAAAHAAASPPAATATIQSLAWLAGTWRGSVKGGQLAADVMFSPPEAGTIVGAVRIRKESELAVIELLSLRDTPNGVELRFRHFGGDLAAYESDFRQNLLVTAVSDSDVTFTNQVPYDAKLMSTQPRTTRFIRRGPDEFVGRSDIIGDDGKPAVIEASYRRVR